MQIVIDIPEENYEVLLTKIMLACRGCKITELVKRHGRLIDADAKNKELTDDYHGMISDESMKIYKIIQMLDDAPTIIEADEGDK